MEQTFYEWLLLLTFIGCFSAIVSSGERRYLLGVSIVLFTNGFIEVKFGYNLVLGGDLIGLLSKVFIESFVLNVVYVAALWFISESDAYSKHEAPPQSPYRDATIMQEKRSDLIDKIMGPRRN
jgi:hypothetical protein